MRIIVQISTSEQYFLAEQKKTKTKTNTYDI